MTDQSARFSSESRVRRTTVPHPQRWRSPHDAGWSDQPHATVSSEARSDAATRTRPTTQRYGRPVRRFQEMVVYAAGQADGECWVEAKQAELDIFAVRNGWATDESRAAGEVLDYVPFAAQSEIFIATPADDPSNAVGVARMVWGASDRALDEQFLVTSMHRIEPEWVWLFNLVGFDRVAEWATLGAVGSNLSPMFALWSAVYRSARARGVDYWVQSIVEGLFTGYRDGFKMPMMQIGEREIVVGAESIPTVLFLEEIGIGKMVSWDRDLKRQMFGAWADRREPDGDPNDLAAT